MIGSGLRIGFRQQTVIADAFVVSRVAPILIAKHQRVLRVQRQIQTRAYVGAGLRRQHGLTDGFRHKTRVQRGRVDERILVDRTPLHVEAKRGLPLHQRPADVQTKELLLVRRAFGLFQKRAARIQTLVVELREELAANVVAAGARQNLDAPEARAVVFGRERIRVDAYLANRRFRRHAAARKTVDHDLPAVGPGGRSGQCLKLFLQFVGVVGERVEFLLAQHQRGAVVGRIGGNAAGLFFHVHDLRLHLDNKLRIEFHIAANGEFAMLVHRKTLGDKTNLILTGTKSGELVAARGVGVGAALSARPSELHQCRGHRGAARIGHRAVQTRRRRGLRGQVRRAHQSHSHNESANPNRSTFHFDKSPGITQFRYCNMPGSSIPPSPPDIPPMPMLMPCCMPEFWFGPRSLDDARADAMRTRNSAFSSNTMAVN